MIFKGLFSGIDIKETIETILNLTRTKRGAFVLGIIFAAVPSYVVLLYQDQRLEKCESEKAVKIEKLNELNDTIRTAVTAAEQRGYNRAIEANRAAFEMHREIVKNTADLIENEVLKEAKKLKANKEFTNKIDNL